MADKTTKQCATCKRECEPDEPYCYGCGRPLEEDRREPKTDPSQLKPPPKTRGR